MFLWKQATALVVVSALASGCYSTYTVPREEFARLQRSDEPTPLEVVKTSDGEGVEVDRDTGIYVRSVGGRRYAVTPFNFKVTDSQLVASDRDTLLRLDEIQDYEVDHLSVPWTATFIAIGAAAAAGLIVAIIATSGDKTFE
jgi:hypothetical protein